MRFFSEEEKTVVVKVPKGSQCNKCGNVFTPRDENIIPVKISCGQFGNWGQDLCQECLFKIVKEFMIVPEGFMSDPSLTSKFDTDHDLHQQLFDEWKETGEWNYDENPWNDYYAPEYPEDEENDLLNELFEDSKTSQQTTLKIVK